jgi:hypothetical protein
MKSSEKTKSQSDARRGKYATESTVGEQELRERIAQKAYELYQKHGQAQGCDLEDWLEAEKVVLAQLEKERHSTIKIPRTRSNRLKRIERPKVDKEQTRKKGG